MDLPNMWIYRDLEQFISPNEGPLRIFPVWLILGPRQSGKSSLLTHCMEKERSYITFDDLQTRLRALEDPQFFIQSLTLPFCIDEIQYVPEILSEIKKIADSKPPPGSIWLTGSQNFEIMKGVQETLAGRVAILNLFGLTDSEKKISALAPKEYFQNILQTNFPGLATVNDSTTRNVYLSSYSQTYIERDIREILGISKRREFELFLKICALRTGQLINYDDMARDTGVSPPVVKEWLSLLEDSFLLKIIPPWHSNKTKRLVKSSKLYFLDIGLAAYLMGWQTPEQLLLGPSSGAIFESHIISNLYRHLKHQLKNFDLHFWRSRDKEEIDIILEVDEKRIAIEIKLGHVSKNHLLPLEKTKIDSITSAYVVSLMADKNPVYITDQWQLIHPNTLIEAVLTKISLV